MKRLKRLVCNTLLILTAICSLSISVFAVTEAEVEAQVAAIGKEGVAGNVLIWFLCAVAFLKISQKIDSFMSSLGINVGHTGGSMLGEAMIAARGIGAIKGISGNGRYSGNGGSSNGGSQSHGGSYSGSTGRFLAGGLAGVVSRQVTSGAIQSVTNNDSNSGLISPGVKDANDTNTDFDDIDNAIRSGYYLKEGLFNSEDFFYLNLLITITAQSEDELDWKVSEMRKLLLSQDMQVSVCSFRQEQAFLSSLPFVNMDRKLYEHSKRNLLTSGAASCYPFTSYEMCDNNGILLGVNKYNSSLIIVDIFNSTVYKNANMAILGTSGAGKTFTMQLMALRMRRKGIPIFIIAPLKGHEFHRACANVGGEFIQISPASPHCINVMEIRRIDQTANELLDGGRIQLSKLAQKIQQLHIFFSLLIPDMTHEERQLLDEAMIRTYNAKGITHDNESLEDPENPGNYRQMPVLGDLHAILIKSRSTQRLANILNRLVNGSARSFNQQTNVSLENKYTVLDISSLTGDLLTIGMFVALDFVWDRAKQDRTEEKAIFIDECWQLLSGAGATGTRLAGDFLLEIAKTIRGFGGSAVFASQDLNDFFNLDDGRFGKGIINNSKTKIILNLEDDEAMRVQSTLHLSDAEVLEITHFERGNGLISTNNNNVMVEFKASPLERELITTDRRELKSIVDKLRQQNNAS